MPAAHTPNLNLNKPDRQDLVSVVTDINDNMDTIDGAIGALPSGHTIQGQINTLKPVSIVLNPVTNANGETTVITQDSRINEGLKAVYIEVGTPETFLAPIRITTGEGQIELYCANAVGSSTVTVVVEMATVTDSADPQPASVTSTEFDILANRIGTLSQLTTTQKTNVVGAINEINGNITQIQDNIILTQKITVTTGAHGGVQISNFTDFNPSTDTVLYAMVQSANANYYCVLTASTDERPNWLAVINTGTGETVKNTSVTIRLVFTRFK